MSGLIQKVDVPPTENIDTPPAESNGKLDNSWYWDEGRPGDGERPEWLETKYTKVTDQAKAYKELQKMLGSRNEHVPDDYDLKDFGEILDLENPAIADLKAKAKDLKLSQDHVKTLVDSFANYHKSMLPDTDAEIAKLGEHANTRINTVNTWASNHLSDAALETLGAISNTAAVVELMDEIRQLHLQTASKVPAGHAPIKAEVVTPQMVQAEIVQNYERYKADPQYRREMSVKMARAVGEEQFMLREALRFK